MKSKYMRDAGDWGWWASDDGGERFTVGPEDSREAIIQGATNDELGMDDDDNVFRFTITNACQGAIDIASLINVSEMEERWEERELEDMRDPESGDGVLRSVTPEQWADLQTRLRAAATAWQDEHKIVIRPWAFMETRNEEEVTVPFPADEEARPAQSD